MPQARFRDGELLRRQGVGAFQRWRSCCGSMGRAQRWSGCARRDRYAVPHHLPLRRRGKAARREGSPSPVRFHRQLRLEEFSDRKSVVSGKREEGRVYIGGGRIIKKK